MFKSAKIAFIALIVLGVFVIVVFYRSLRQNQPLDLLNQQAETKKTLVTKPQITFLDPVIGPANAKVTIVEFADFRCSHCVRANAELKKIMEAYPNEVRLVWKDFPFLPPADLSWRAHEAARCAGEQKKFWEYHDALFAEQNYYSSLRFLELASTLGLDKEMFTKCFESGKMKPIIRRLFDEGEALGVDGAPYFFINGERWSGEMTKEKIEEFIGGNK